MRLITLLPTTLAAALLIGACRPSLPPMPEGHDILLYAVEQGTGLLPSLDCHWFFLTADSDSRSEAHRADWDTLGFIHEWSPDGHWIAADEPEGSGLLLINASTGMVQSRLEAPGFHDITWSPDSRRLAYTTSDKQIAWVDVSCLQRGEECQPQATTLHPGEQPAWSPDGASIAFAWDAGLNHPIHNRIFTMKADGSGQRTDITSSIEGCSHPSWSPDASRIAFDCNWDIYISEQDGRDPTNLTFGGGEDGWPVDELPTWSSKGDRILFLSDREPGGQLFSTCLSDTRENALYSMAPDGSDIRQVTALGAFDIASYTWIISAP